MTWFREHLPALGAATGAAIVLAGSLYVLDVVPRSAEQFETTAVSPGDPIDIEGYRLTNVSFSERDDDELLPDGARLYAVDVDYMPPASYDTALCIEVTIVEVDGQQRVFEVFHDGELLRTLGDFPATCIASFDGAPGTERLSFVLPENHGSLALVFGTPFGDRVQVAAAD